MSKINFIFAAVLSLAPLLNGLGSLRSPKYWMLLGVLAMNCVTP